MTTLVGYRHGFGADVFTVYDMPGFNGHTRFDIVIGWALMAPHNVRVRAEDGTPLAAWVGADAQAPDGGYLTLADVLDRIGCGRRVFIPAWLASTVHLPDSWYEASERQAETAQLRRVVEAAREWERVTTEHVPGTADEVIAARRAARAELHAALAALETQP